MESVERLFSKALLGEAGQWSNVIRNAKPCYYLEGLFLSFFKFLSSFFLILGHSGELKNVTTMFKECITENLIRCTKARLSMDGALGTEVKKKKVTHNICGRFNFFYFFF